MRMFRKSGAAVFVLLILSICCVSHTASAAEAWIGTWATGQQLVETQNNPASPGLANNTLRQIVHASLGGSRIRVQFSNKYSTGATTINSAHIALSNGGIPINSSIDTGTDTALTFGGSASVTIPAGEEIYSDAVDFNVPPLSNLTVSIYFGSDVSSTSVTGHPGSRTGYYLKTGNTVSDAEMESGYKTEHWYVLSRVDVWLDDSYGCVVALGDSITDGRGCNPNYDNRWPDLFAARLNGNPTTSKVGVINQGIGGNCVVSGGLGPTALARFDHDVIGQPGVKWVIIFEGTNDIGSSGQSAANIISAYQTFITNAHNAGIKIYGATITPFRGSGYYSTAHEDVRDTVNDWIRTSGEFDAVIDFDASTWDPADHDYLNPPYRVYPPGDQNDYLHFNADGYQAMVDDINLALFEEQRGADVVAGNMMLINDNGGWCWYQDDKVIYDPVGRNVLTSTAAEGTGFGGVGGARTNDMDSTTFNIDTGKRTRFNAHEGFGGDDHNMGAFWIRPDGRYLHIYCQHYNDPQVTYLRLSTNPNDGSAWGSEYTYNWETISGLTDTQSSSYTNVYYLSGEGTGQGRLYNIIRVFTRTPCISYSDDMGQTWQYMGQLNSPAGGSTYSNFYHKFRSNGVDRIDFIGVENHPRDNNNNVYHGYIKNGKSYNSYGTVIDDNLYDQDAPSIQAFTPIFIADTTIDADSYHTGWTNEMEIDKDGYPVGLYQTRHGTEPWGNDSGSWGNIGAADHRFFYARFNGTSWTSTELCKLGGGLHLPEQDYTGMGCINPDDANIVYVSTQFDPRDNTEYEYREIFKGVTSDNGLTWDWTQITFDSTINNTRPAIPPWDANNTAVVWTRGNWGQNNYEDYDLVVVGMVEEQDMTLGLVSYTDASPSNTTNSDGSAFSPTGPSGSAGSADSLWHEYTGYGNGGSCYTAGDGGTENVPTIKTTITGLADGTYDVFAYFWCDPAADWGIRGGFTSAEADMLCFNKQSSQFAEASQFSGSVTVTGSGVQLYRVYIGRKVVSGGGSIVVYLDNYDSTYSNNVPTRTTYDGVGVASVSYAADITPPEPDPMTWATVPAATGSTTITMTATTATDTSLPVQYYFECTTDGSKSSSWQTDPTYVASDLTPSTLYSFRVKARDSATAQNETGWSSTESATTNSPDTTPPTPDPMTWATVPTATGPSTITMTATTATDDSPPVEYLFECTTDGSKSSSWQTNATYVASGLNEATLYSFRVKARDSAPALNETGWSSTQSATTNPPDTTPPTPNPMTWLTVPTETGPYSITMTANTATDSESPPVQYYFECTTDGSKTSGWQTSVTYAPSGLVPSTSYSFRVKARDSAAAQNETGWSSTQSATTEAAPIDVEILGSWTTGTSHTKESGVNRALIFIAHGEMDGTMNLTAVTYGGQAMTKVVDRDYRSGIDAYVAAFILDEAGVAAATNSTFTPTWSTTPTEVKYASVFLSNVNQSTLTGASATNGGTSATISTSALATNNGDMVIDAATNGNTGTYTLNNGFTQGSHQSSTSSTGVTGYKLATGASETPSVTHNSVNRQAVIGFVVQGGGTPPVLNTASNPYPANGAGNISVSTSLSWDAPTAYTPTSYKVYFGTDTTAHNNPSYTVYTESYDPPGDLLEGTTYYWAVDSNDAGTIYAGDNWSFTTYEPITIGDLVADYIISQALSTYYASACSYYGALVYSEVVGDTGLRDSVIAAFPSTYYTGATLPPEGSVDENVYGILPFELYRQTGDANYLTSALYLADEEFANPRPDGLSEYTRFWIDDTYMIGSLQAQAYKSMADINYADYAVTQLLGYMGEVEDLQQSNGLFYHTLSAPIHWGRGNGWAAAAMTEVLLAIPSDHPQRAQLLTKCQNMMAGLVTYQGASGMWYQVLDMGSDPRNWYESSCTGMFVFALATGVREGWLPEVPYKQAALDGWAALADYVDEQGRVEEVCTGTSQSTDVQYYFDRPREVGNPHGQAAVIWAATAMELLFSSDITPPAAPTGLSATAGDGTVSLDWDDNNEPDLDGYNVYRSTTSGSGYSQINGSLLNSSDYTDNSVTNGTTYYYVVTAVDTNSNESEDSNEDFATPTGPPDTTPPTPDPMTWSTLPTATGQTTITMTATTATDVDTPPVQYYFECTNDGSKSSGWQTSATYVASGLTPDTLYSFRVRARDSAATPNETGWSSTQSATTDPPDTTPPTPDPMTWSSLLTATGSATITMTASTATDAESPPVEYYFECTTDGSKTSGWQSGSTYIASGLTPSTLYSFRVKARDSAAALNETSYSSTESATTDEAPTDIEILGSWTTGTSHTKETGTNRALIFIAHGESADSMNLSAVTYGGQSMTKVTEYNYNAASGYAYAAAFILKESGVAAASSGTFSTTWSGTAPGNAGYASVFLSNVDQTTSTGATGNGGSTSNPVTTSSALATNSGDMVILGATCGNSGSYTLNNSFTEGTDQQIGGTVTGATGHKLATGANETPSATYSSTINRQMIIGFVVKAAPGGGPVTRTLTVSSTGGGLVTTPGIGDFNYTDGTNASIVASANANYHFVNWTGTAVTAGKVASPTSASTTVTMDGDYTVVANFAIDTFTLDYAAGGTGGSLTGDTSQVVNYGSNGTAVTAVPDTGYHFVNWSDASTNNPRTDLNVTANINVTANFAIDTFTLDYAAGAGGSLTGDTSQVVNYGEDGTAVTAVPDTGYHFVNWSDASTNNPRTDLNVTANINVTANFAIDTFTLDYAAGAGGSLTGNTSQVVNYGEDGTAVTAVPDTGYHFVNWSDTSTDNPRTDLNVTANINVTANFAIDTFTLDYAAGAGGSLTGVTSQVVNYGEDGTAVTAVPDTGYHFVNWSDASTDNPRTDLNVTANINVTANFAIDTFTLDYAAGAGGSLTGDTSQVVNYGEDGTAVTAVPDTGYHFVNWSDASTDNPRTDLNVTANINVTANFAVDTFTLDYAAGAGGSLTGVTSQVVNYGEDGTAVMAVPDTGYHFANWSDASTDNPRTDLNVTANINVTANFAIDRHTLTSSSTAGGSVTTPGEGSFDYDYGTGASIVATANPNYHFVEWTGSAVTAGKVASPTSASTTITMDGDYTVVANFAEDTVVWTLTTSSTANGSVTTPGEGDFDYDEGTYANITATADLNYHFTAWTGSAVMAGKVASPTSASTTVLMDASYTVIANFTIDTFTLDYAAGAGGSLMGDTSQVVNYGEDGTAVTAVPDTGYHFVNWSDASTENPRTDLNATANINVTANFAIDTFTLDYAAGAGGSLTGDTSQVVNYGEDGTAVTAVPNTGYHFVNWSDASTDNPRTDLNVTANISVTANFAIDLHALTSSSTAGGSVTTPGEGAFDYDYGTYASIVATAETDYHFVIWTGTAVSAGKVVDPCAASTTVLMDSGYTVIANFEADPVDETPPLPDPMTWATVPTATGSTTITMTATTATDSESPPVEYYFECTNDGSKTSGWQTSTTYVASGLNPSTMYSFRVKARDSATTPNETGWSSTESAMTNIGTGQTPYPGPDLHAIPGILEAENYDDDGEGVAYHDLTSGNEGGDYRTDDVDVEACSEGNYNIGWLESGEWLEYSVIVETTGTYDIEARVGANGAGGSFHLEFDGNDVTGAVSVPDTGAWQTYTSIYINNVSLTAGAHIMRLSIDSSWWNVTWFDFAPTPDTTPPAPPTGLTATAGNDTVSLDWNDNNEPDLKGYNVYRSTIQGGDYNQINTMYMAGSYYVDNDVNNGTVYYYVVTAVDTNNNESDYSNEDSATPGYQNCADVQNDGYGLASDLDGNCYVDYWDMEIIASYWLSIDCTEPDNCEGADFVPTDGVVDLYDLSDFAAQWLLCNDPEDAGCVPNW